MKTVVMLMWGRCKLLKARELRSIRNKTAVCVWNPSGYDGSQVYRFKFKPTFSVCSGTLNVKSCFKATENAVRYFPLYWHELDGRSWEKTRDLPNCITLLLTSASLCYVITYVHNILSQAMKLSFLCCSEDCTLHLIFQQQAMLKVLTSRL